MLPTMGGGKMSWHVRSWLRCENACAFHVREAVIEKLWGRVSRNSLRWSWPAALWLSCDTDVTERARRCELGRSHPFGPLLHETDECPILCVITWQRVHGDCFHDVLNSISEHPRLQIRCWDLLSMSPAEQGCLNPITAQKLHGKPCRKLKSSDHTTSYPADRESVL